MKRLIIILSLLNFCYSGKAQKEFRMTDSSILHIDTVQINGEGYHLLHYHKVSMAIEKKVLLDTGDSIFDNHFNNFSRLVFGGHHYNQFNIPTIPLTHIVFIKKLGLIIGLSNLTMSHYQVVIYSVEGKLLNKIILGPFELKLNKPGLKKLFSNYPDLKTCLAKMPVYKENDSTYYLGISSCVVDVIGRDSIIQMRGFRASHFFPEMISQVREEFYYTKFYNFYSESDPLYDLITIGSIPYLLILNSEDGNKVNIPLGPSCDIVKELDQ